MKNSGSSFVKEVATREFMEEMTHLIKIPVSLYSCIYYLATNVI